MINADCGDSGFCSSNQEDTYPPGGDSFGDACSICESDFECDEDVDGSDATLFKNDFGRRNFNNPCENDNACNGDFDCDGDCDGTDVAKFKEDFGRTHSTNPAPHVWQVIGAVISQARREMKQLSAIWMLVLIIALVPVTAFGQAENI